MAKNHHSAGTDQACLLLKRTLLGLGLLAATSTLTLSLQCSLHRATSAVEARLSLVFIEPALDGGAIHIDDVSFTDLDLAFDTDADSDADVDGADFLSWQSGFGRNDGTSVADGDFDGLVAAGDLAVWEQNYGGALAISATTQPGW